MSLEENKNNQETKKEESKSKIKQTYISIESDKDIKKRKNLFISSAVFWFVWMSFHFTVVMFFWIILKSIVMVWIFLWIANLTALLIDIPIWRLQKYFKAKDLIMTSGVAMLLSVLIFLYIITISSFVSWVSAEVSDILSFILWDAFNVLLLIFASILYWFAQELFNVTVLSYIMNNADPSEYSKLISKNWIYFMVWSIIWVVSAGFLLAVDPKISLLVLFFLIIFLLFFINKFFWNMNETIDLSQIKNLKLTAEKENSDKTINYLTAKIKTIDFKKIASQTKNYLFLKPIQIRNKVDWPELTEEVKVQFKLLKQTLFSLPVDIFLVWVMAIVMYFSFWDNFVATFQIEFLNKILQVNKWDYKVVTWILVNWYIFLLLLAIPAFLFQWFFIKLAKRIWEESVIFFWLFLSGFAIFWFWLSSNLYFIIWFWILNSIWYAATFPTIQWIFLKAYTRVYSEKQNVKEIDSSIASAPLKIVLNTANVVWLAGWWFLVTIFWFNSFFFIFWTLIILTALIWLKLRKSFKW